MVSLKFEDFRQTFIFYLIDKFVLAVLIGLVVFFITSTITKNQINKVEEIRSNLQGLWLVETVTEKSDYNPYLNLNLFLLAAINVDKNFQIEGSGFKIGERDFTFPLSNRAKFTISGSIIDTKVSINFYTFDKHTNTESLTVLDGNIAMDRIDGVFKTDVANSEGKFCAIRVKPEETVESFSKRKIC